MPFPVHSLAPKIKSYFRLNILNRIDGFHFARNRLPSQGGGGVWEGEAGIKK